MTVRERTAPRLLGAGLVCLDIINRDGKVQYYNGGSCGNVASGLSFLGWENAVLIGQYKDEAAKLLNCNLDGLGVKRIEVKHGSLATPRIIEEFINGPQKEHRFSLVCPRCGRELPRLSPLPEKSVCFLELDDFNVFYSDRASKGIALLRKLFKDKGAWTVYEPNSSRNVNSLVTHALDSHIVKFSAAKVSMAIADTIRNESTHGATVLIVRTMGAEGLVYSYRTRNNTMSQWKHLDVQPVPHFVDSCGAGDWCTAGMLYSLVHKYPNFTTYLTHQDVVASLQYGQALSAISCCFLGAQGLIYSDVNEEMEKKLLGDRARLFTNSLIPATPSDILSSDNCEFCLLER
ncbi:PfkB family carbohydrate kinase [Desulfitobacterium sp.]|uniref:PfkB family carbohydrate kinase n=1 Tax=Desulfitobacterium sp. TaxID=49981 RepID=UPI002C960D53|nr:PfkB family carbohydrate kinase [Desulfitobacterium sp.]HVJ50264.1 PfkB family carbohydrate kinase [Desulfitobacterium sp.]